MQGAIHEIHSSDPADEAAMGFLVRLLSRLQAAAPQGQSVWASCRPDLFGPGLNTDGIDPGRLLLVHCKASSDLSFVIEESFKYKYIYAIIADIGELDFSVSRRLQIAAAETGAILFLLRPARFLEAPSAAVTRWLAVSRSGGDWSLTLLRCRGGRPAQWLMRGAQPLNANDNLEITVAAEE